jgi:asparagine synthase (glutamine-hydrolysing)
VCGIAGFLERGPRPDQRDVISRMTSSLRRRGPDDEGLYCDEHVALGARRLSIVDLENGHQPVSNASGTIQAVLNGEIYNFGALRADLQSLGHRFRTASDSEVIVHAYEAYGPACVARLDGMFAFAVWDRSHRTLMLARDRMGEKPLYYYAGAGAFVFGSELRALLEHPAVPRELSLDGLIRYLAFEYVPAPHSIVAGVAKLSPGHVATVSMPDLEVEVGQYWDLPFRPDYSVSEAEWADRLRWQLEASIRRRLVSDVPVGFFLSGGLDSSSVVALAARVGDGRPLKTFSIGFEEPSYDERPFARATAEHCGTRHTEAVFGPRDALALLDRAGDLLDEPLVDGSFLPLHVLSGLARRDVTVVLSGDGPDELLCGYPTFLADRGSRWVECLPGAIRGLLRRAVQRLPASGRYGSIEFLLKQFFRGLAHPPEIRTQLLLGGLTALERSALLSEPVLAACARLDPYDELVRTIAAPQGLNSIDRLVYQHCKFYLPDQNLTTVDRASMSCGLEVRAPFLDHALVELAGQIPAHLKLRGWTTKHILKRAVRDVLPPAILHRRKQGFGVPIGAWLRGPLRGALEERLAFDRVARRGLFDPSTVERLVREHLAGLRDHWKILWSLLMFDAWCARYLPRVVYA